MQRMRWHCIGCQQLHHAALPDADSVCCLQMEAFARFFVGVYKVDLTYDDDFVSICKQNVCSPGGFWFDCATSIPWSFMDLRVYLVSFHEQTLAQNAITSA